MVAPVAGLYVYGDGAIGVVDSDTSEAGTQRSTVAAGLGQDLLRAFGVRSTQALTVRYDLYFLSVAEPDPRYFSPDAYLTHTPGFEWRWSPRGVTLGLEGGLPLRADAPTGGWRAASRPSSSAST